MHTFESIAKRMAEIKAELETATGDALEALERETNELLEERAKLEREVQAKQELRAKVASGAVPTAPIAPVVADDSEERAAKEFANTRKMSLGVEQTRSVLVSGGTLATPTQVGGINDPVGASYSSIVDMVYVENCEGMSAHRVAYVIDADEAATQTEGSAATAKEPTFGYKDITPTSVAVTSQISKQAKKQTPLNYKAKVQRQAYISLRKKAASICVAALQGSDLAATVPATIASAKGKVDEKTLRALVLAYGGNEAVGTGVLFLNKTDLIAFGDVRGTNEKKAVYEITPDGANPNIGIIKDGGLSVKYCIVSGLTACNGTAQAAADKKTMFYGDPKCLELDLFSPYEVRVSEDFAFTSLMDTIVGDVELGADVVVPNGFVALTIAHS